MEPAPLPFAAPCRRLATSAPWDWLRRAFVAPLVAIAPYSISTQLARGEKPSFRACMHDQLRLRGTAMVFALVLLVIFLVWARAASMISVFFPFEADPAWRDLIPYLGIGSAAGSVFALSCFATSAQCCCGSR
jgi:Predicted integral membrane protein (DUF2189)